MPRVRKTTRYEADAATIRRYFELSWQARDEQKTANGLINGLNSEMAAAGVHPGVMSTMRRIKAMPDGKRGFHLFLLRRYCDILEGELYDPTFAAEAEAKPAGSAVTVPFDARAA
jgi:hypothetical protein